MEDVWSKLARSAYTNPEPYPALPYKPVLAIEANSTQIHDYAHKLEAHEQALVIFRAQQTQWHLRTVALEAEFRHDLEKMYNMVSHAKADLLYNKSWDLCRSSDPRDMAAIYVDLMDLVL